MKKLLSICLLSAVVATAFTSCAYQNYNTADAHFSPLTGDSYASNTAWNTDHYNIAKSAAPVVHPAPVRPIYSSIVVTAQ